MGTEGSVWTCSELLHERKKHWTDQSTVHCIIHHRHTVQEVLFLKTSLEEAHEVVSANLILTCRTWWMRLQANLHEFEAITILPFDIHFVFSFILSHITVTLQQFDSMTGDCLQIPFLRSCDLLVLLIEAISLPKYATVCSSEHQSLKMYACQVSVTHNTHPTAKHRGQS